MNIARTLLNSDAFAGLGSTEILPGADISDTAAIDRYIRQHCVTVHHPVGTCQMGPGRDAVTDPQLRVRGIDGLRVVDASVMPRIIGGNTAAPVLMIAEKAADLVRNLPAAPPRLSHPPSNGA